eukprot:snap_masked-scaffold_2-processed-gene-18.41-mRNA-1 protein AED:0.03 eAED:0.03 QI:0/0/0/1/1/1/2/0/237
MAGSRYEYVRKYEDKSDICMLIRIDGQSFHHFTKQQEYSKPNDIRGLNLFSKASEEVLSKYNDILVSYSQSDEVSFLFKKNTKLFNRRKSKILSTIVSIFTAAFVYHWKGFFNTDLNSIPTFDGRIICYPNELLIQHYFSWRQVDCHVNNLYNTTFWSLVNKSGLSTEDAKKKLDGTFSKDKHEILFSEFGINYNEEPEIFKKGTTLIQRKNVQQKIYFERYHGDIMKEKFWQNILN